MAKKNKNNRQQNQNSEDMIPAELRGKGPMGPKNQTTQQYSYGNYYQNQTPPAAPSGPVKLPGFSWEGDDRYRGKMCIVFNDDVYREIMYYINKVNYEVSGWGKLLLERNGDEQVLRCVSFHLAKQKGTGGETTIEGVDLARLEYETRELPGVLRLWIHSHPTFAAFWSGQDMSNIRDQSAPGWIAAVVFNQKAEARAAVAFGGELPYFNDNVPMRVETVISKDEAVKWHENFMKHIEYGVSTVQGNKIETERPAAFDWRTRHGAALAAESRQLAPISQSSAQTTGSTIGRAEAKILNLQTEKFDKLESDILSAGLAMGLDHDRANSFVEIARRITETHGAMEIGRVKQTIIKQMEKVAADTAEG